MQDIEELVAGYRRFLDDRYPREAASYRALAEDGQKPKTMVIACCDSRVDPAAIFNAGPGQLFVVRNVANLVPPFEAHGDYHGTSAALEFAVGGLGVENILVMGHAQCGGIAAFREGLHDWSGEQGFIGQWMSLLDTASQSVMRETASKTEAEQQEALEHAAVRHSLDNLLSFPFIERRVAAGALRLRGAYFGIANGILLSLNPQTGTFERLQGIASPKL